jgi:hypothetical protein
MSQEVGWDWEIIELDVAERALEPARRIVERLETMLSQGSPGFHFDGWDTDLAEFLTALQRLER